MTGCSSGQCLDEKWIVVRTWMITIRPIIPRINLTIPNFMTECVTSPNLVVVLFRSTANHHNGLEPPAIWLVHFGVRDVKRDEACQNVRLKSLLFGSHNNYSEFTNFELSCLLSGLIQMFTDLTANYFKIPWFSTTSTGSAILNSLNDGIVRTFP